MTRTSRRRSAAALALALAIGAAHAAEARGPLDSYLERIREALEAAAAARAPTPPVAVPVIWRAKKIGDFDLGALVVALDAADLDGDGRDELVALTTAEVAILAVTDKAISTATRAPLPPAPALIRSRDPVGSLVIDGGSIAARTSEQGAGAVYQLDSGKLVLRAEAAAVRGFPLCAGLSAELSAGRNTFDMASARWAGEPPLVIGDNFVAAECRRHTGADGRPIDSVAVVSASRVVEVVCKRGAGARDNDSDSDNDDDGACGADALAASEIKGSGYAVEVADVDRDGRLEVITSHGQAPGSRDRVRAFAVVDGKPRLVFDHRFDGGVVALSAPDLDGDGAREVIAAVRPWQTTRTELWVLTRRR